jgi:hypothetical protein
MDNVRRRWQREVAIVLAVGVALALATRSLGSTGMLLAILGVTAIACLFPRLNQPLSQSAPEEL